MPTWKHSRLTIEKEQAEINRYKAEVDALKKQLEEKQERLNRSRDRYPAVKPTNRPHAILQEAKDLRR